MMGKGTRIIMLLLAIDMFLFIGTDLHKNFLQSMLIKFAIVVTPDGNLSWSFDQLKTAMESWMDSMWEIGTGAFVGFLLGGVTGAISGAFLFGVFGDFIFAPLEVMKSVGIPWQIQLLFGAFWSFMFIIAMLEYVRGAEL